MINVYKTSIGENIIKAQDLKNGGSGLYDDPCADYKPCTDHAHNPPSHLCIPVGKVYKHICPSCKHVSYLRPMQIFMSTQIGL